MNQLENRAGKKTKGNRIEQCLLMLTIVLLPLESQIPAIGGFGFMFIVFGVVGGYLVLARFNALLRVCLHPIALSGFLFVYLIFLNEMYHPLSDNLVIKRIAQMFVGALFIGALCRTKAILRAGLYGYIIVGVLMSFHLFSTTWGVLGGATAVDFNEASRLRGEAFGDAHETGRLNLNFMGFIAAQGAIVGLGLGLMARTSMQRYVFWGISLFCLVGTSLSMSRGGIGTVVLSAGTIIGVYLFRYGLRDAKQFMRLIALGLVLVLGAAIWVPEAVYSRLSFSTEKRDGKMEGRAQVYTAAFENLPDTLVTGVGAGNYWKSWAAGHGFAYGIGVLGTHNVFLQIALYWGLMGLVPYLFLLYQVYRHVPRPFGENVLTSCLLGVCVSLLMLMMVRHNAFAKEFSIGYGLIIGASTWIWPKYASVKGRAAKLKKHFVQKGKRPQQINTRLRIEPMLPSRSK